VRAFARGHHVIDAARDEDGVSWHGLSPALADLSLFAVAVAEEHGGVGGTLCDLAAGTRHPCTSWSAGGSANGSPS
jgi:hypothetical protein